MDSSSSQKNHHVTTTSTDTSNTVRCETIIKTGSRIGTKICKTNAQWEQERRDSREATERVQRGGVQSSTKGGG
ncbi:MAG: hypothetical protein ACK5ME_09265 [Parahaliea sp.]